MPRNSYYGGYMTTASEVFNAYLSAFESGDMDRARALMTDDFSFDGPMLQVDGCRW